MNETACQKSSEKNRGQTTVPSGPLNLGRFASAFYYSKKKSAHVGRFALSIPYRDEGSEATG